ncbi:MAG: SpoIIE family protein phosphatase [Gemmatimonadales bacterium]|nr:SpoIIE family protein phosphatase [Gemmatimonadales bacterium]
MELHFQQDGSVRKVLLSDGEHLVGRSPSVAVCLPFPEISSIHASLRIMQERVFLKELGSTNGTEVCGKTMTRDGGEIEITGCARILFAGIPVDLVDSGSSSSIPKPTECTSQDEIDSITRLTLGSYTLDQEFSEVARAKIVEMLSSLFELIAADEAPGCLATPACEFISRWVSADRVVLLEDSGEGTPVEPSGSWTSDGGSTEDIRLSSTLVQRVVNDRTGVLLADIQAPNVGPSESMVAQRLCSVMAVPLFDNERVRGILYVDSRRKEVHYKQDDLQVVTATANAVAVKLRNLSMERELAMAARIQQAMLPAQLPDIPGHELLARLDMCRSVGGDLYHVIQRPNGRILMALGDVAGKGTPAALAMSATMVLLSTLAEIGGDVSAMLDLCHRKLFESLAPEQFLTLFLGELDFATGQLIYVNAGHELPIISRVDGTLELLPPGGPPVALIPEASWQCGEVQLLPGDLLAVFSDGIPEATLDADDFLGLEGVKEILGSRRMAPLPEISNAIGNLVSEFLKGSHSSDDVTLMLLRRTPDNEFSDH